MGALDEEGRQVLHSAKARGLLQGREEVADGKPVHSFGAVGGRPAARGHGREDAFAPQGRAAGAVGPSVLQDQVQPLLQQGGYRIPEEGVLPDHDVVGFEPCLLGLHVHVEPGIGLVEIVELDLGLAPRGLHQAAVDARALEGRVGEEDEDAAHARSSRTARQASSMAASV
jgi:hypothetical protein